MDDLFFGYPPLPSTLKQLSGLEKSQFEILWQSTENLGFDRGINRCKKLSSDLKGDLSPRDVFNILGSLRFLYDRCRSWEKSELDWKEQFKEFLELTGLTKDLGEDFGKIGYEGLYKLVAKNRNVEKKRKNRWLKTGILNTVVDVSSRVDIRPHFSEDKSKIEDLVPGLVLRIITEGSNGEENHHVFQLTKEGLSKFRESLIEAEKKLEVLTSDPILGQRISDV